jgi:hypothetical protein
MKGEVVIADPPSPPTPGGRVLAAGRGGAERGGASVAAGCMQLHWNWVADPHCPEAIWRVPLS